MRLFGYDIVNPLRKAGLKVLNGNLPREDQKQRIPVVGKSFAPKVDDEGSMTVEALGGWFGSYLDVDGTTVTSDSDLILKYRNAAQQPECDHAVSAVTDEVIVVDDEAPMPVTLKLDRVELADEVKEAIRKEFDIITRLLQFSRKGSDVFRQWYVDGKAYYHMITDAEKPEEGILELRWIDPFKMKKIREIETTIDENTGAKTITTVAEYFVYTENQIAGQLIQTVNSGDAINGLKIQPETISYVSSGLLDSSRRQVISHLHKALKLVNQVRMMEDAIVIYRISRAPERRIFYIDVGGLPKGKAEEYMKSIMSKYRNKMVYDASTGNLRDDRQHMSLLEDFWLPRRDGKASTEISTLPSGSYANETDALLYFKKNLYRALNVPISRLDPDGSASFSFGRPSEISREEVAFQKFINRVRRRFSDTFLIPLKTQLLLKKICTAEDWDEIIEPKIVIDYRKDNYFSELKETEILKERLAVYVQIENLSGRFYSKKWIRRNILKQTDEDIEIIDAEIIEENALASTKPEQSATEDDSSPQDEELNNADVVKDEEGETLIVNDEPAVTPIAFEQIKALADEHGWRVTNWHGEKQDYIKITDPQTGVTHLFDTEVADLNFVHDTMTERKEQTPINTEL